MACSSPLSLRINGVWYDNIPCGYCYQCISRKRRDWFVRLKIEKLHSVVAYFVTLTYNQEHCNGKLNSKHWQIFRQNFVNRFKSYLNDHGETDVKGSFRYFAVGEYGSKKHRPHYHAILFFNSKHCVNHLFDSWLKQSLKACWTWSNTEMFDRPASIVLLNDSLINYIAKYVVKTPKYKHPPSRPRVAQTLKAEQEPKQRSEGYCPERSFGAAREVMRGMVETEVNAHDVACGVHELETEVEDVLRHQPSAAVTIPFTTPPTLMFASKRPFIGHQLLNNKIYVDYVRRTLDFTYRFDDGTKFALPRIYFKKIFTVAEQEELKRKWEQSRQYKLNRIKNELDGISFVDYYLSEETKLKNVIKKFSNIDFE